MCKSKQNCTGICNPLGVPCHMRKVAPNPAKDDKFVCIEDVRLNDTNEIAYYKGRIYVVESFIGGTVNIPSELFKEHTWPYPYQEFDRHFQPTKTYKVTTVDAELDKDVATFFEWMGRAPVMTREQFLEGTTPMSPETAAGVDEFLKETRGYDDLPPYYDNSKGSLYHIAEQRGWGVRLFDLVKRLERGGKKDPLKQELEKSIGVLQLWIKELEG